MPPQGSGPPLTSLLNKCGHTPWNSAPLQGSGPPGPCRHRPAQPQGSGPPRSMSASLLERCGPRPLNHTSPSSGHPMAPPNENIPETGQVNQTKKKTCNNHTCNASARTTTTTTTQTKQCRACMRTPQGQTSGCPNIYDFPRSSRIWFLAIPICVRHPPTVIFRLLTRSNMSCHHKGRCRIAPVSDSPRSSGSGLWLWALALGSGLLTRHGSSTRPNVGLWRRLALEPQILRCCWGNEIPCAAPRGGQGVDIAGGCPEPLKGIWGLCLFCWLCFKTCWCPISSGLWFQISSCRGVTIVVAFALTVFCGVSCLNFRLLSICARVPLSVLPLRNF